jgi:glycerol kinase
VYGTGNIQGTEVPIAGVAGDQQAALFGQCCFEKGEAKNTYGTGCFLLMNTGAEPCESRNGLLTTIAAFPGGSNSGFGSNSGNPPVSIRYALEGSVFVAGAVIQWLRDEMRFITESSDSEYYAGKVNDTGGVYLVPAFTGLGAPYWDQYARGAIVGITRGTKRYHIIRAAEESIAYQSLDLVQAMEKDTGAKIAKLRVDGGATRDGFLMQFQADIMNCRISRPVIRETTALGAAYLAGIAVGFWKGVEEVRAKWKEDAVFVPQMGQSQRDTLVAGWHKAVGRSRDWAE